jgi:sec-independent protein translocase protein TatC
VGINLKLYADWLQFPIDFAGLDIDLRTRQPLGVLMVMMQVVFFGGLAVSLPFIIMFVSGFVAPGLTKREKRMLLPGSIAAVILFLAGAALAFFFIIPVSLKFSAVLNEWMNIELLWDVNDYYSLVVMVTLAIGALFQFPLLLVITGYLGILPASKLRKGRKLVFVIIIIVAALLTPGDVIVALVLLTIPLYGLFEGSIIMVAYVERGKARRQARVEERRKKREIDRDTAKQKAASALIKDKPAPAKDREGE